MKQLDLYQAKALFRYQKVPCAKVYDTAGHYYMSCKDCSNNFFMLNLYSELMTCIQCSRSLGLLSKDIFFIYDKVVTV